MGLARRWNMDTSRRPDGPIDSRPDRQLGQLLGLQLMTWLLSWIQSWPLSWSRPSAIIDSADVMRSPGCIPGRSGTAEMDVGRGRRRPPAWRLGASGGRRLRASETDRSGARSGAARPARSYLCLVIRSIPSYPHSRPDGAPTTDFRQGRSRLKTCSKGGAVGRTQSRSRSTPPSTAGASDASKRSWLLVGGRDEA